MMNKQFNLIEAIESIDSTSKDIREFVEMQAGSISSILNEFNRDYKVVTDWSIDPFVSPMSAHVSIYIEVDGVRAFVDKLYAEDLVRSIDAKSVISKCDETYRRYFVD